jgi:hypothetical protein
MADSTPTFGVENLSVNEHDVISSPDEHPSHSAEISNPEPFVEHDAQQVPPNEPEALRLKQLGNEQYSKGENEDAIDLYSQAIPLCGEMTTKAQCFGNRAACYIALVRFPPF